MFQLTGLRRDVVRGAVGADLGAGERVDVERPGLADGGQVDGLAQRILHAAGVLGRPDAHLLAARRERGGLERTSEQ